MKGSTMIYGLPFCLFVVMASAYNSDLCEDSWNTSPHQSRDRGVLLHALRRILCRDMVAKRVTNIATSADEDMITDLTKSEKDDRICRRICNPCARYLNLRVSALCWAQCRKRGRAFDTCVTVAYVYENKSDGEDIAVIPK